jgi:hypothetical protein
VYDGYGYEEPEEREPDEADLARDRYLGLIFEVVGSGGFDPESGHFVDPELDRLAGRFDPEGDLLSQLGAAASFLRRWRVQAFMRRCRSNRPAPVPDLDRFAVAVLLARLLALRAARAVAEITAACDSRAAVPSPVAADRCARILIAAPAAPPALVAIAGATG